MLQKIGRKDSKSHRSKQSLLDVTGSFDHELSTVAAYTRVAQDQFSQYSNTDGEGTHKAPLLVGKPQAAIRGEKVRFPRDGASGRLPIL